MSVTLTRPNGQTLTFDASPSQSWDVQVELTEHPIEDGSTITDHGQVRPRELGITGVVSESPLGTSGGQSRVDNALRFLNGAGEGIERLDVTTRLGTSSGWVLMSWPHDVTAIRGMVFELRLRQVRIASVTVITLPREVPAPRYADTAPPEVDVGTQPTQTVAAPETETVQRSWAAAGFDRLFGGT